jgi:hypothetical protein
VLDQIVNQFIRQGDESVNRVVKNLEFIDLAHSAGFWNANITKKKKRPVGLSSRILEQKLI